MADRFALSFPLSYFFLLVQPFLFAEEQQKKSVWSSGESRIPFWCFIPLEEDILLYETQLLILERFGNHIGTAGKQTSLNLKWVDTSHHPSSTKQPSISILPRKSRRLHMFLMCYLFILPSDCFAAILDDENEIIYRAIRHTVRITSHLNCNFLTSLILVS